MQIECLEYFIKVADAKSINAASYEINISQQALNQSMNNLEKELGATLFQRNNRGIILTDKGKALYAVASDIVESWNRLKSSFYSEDSYEGSYKVGIFPYMEADYYSIFMAYMELNFPKIKIDTINCFNEELIDKLKNEKIDIAITNFKENESYKPLTPDLDYIILNKKKIDVIVGRNSSLANFNSVSFSDLRDYPIALQKVNGNNKYNILLRTLQKNKCDNIFFYNSVYTVQRIIEQGHAVGFIIEDSCLLSECKDKLVKISLAEDFYMVKTVVFRKEDVDKDEILKKILHEICVKLRG